MKRLIGLVLLLALAGLWLPGLALAQRAPSAAPAPEPVTRYLTRFDVVSAPETFDQVMLVLDFAPGAWTPPHTHGGYVYSTVVEGDVAGRAAGQPATGRSKNVALYRRGRRLVGSAHSSRYS